AGRRASRHRVRPDPSSAATPGMGSRRFPPVIDDENVFEPESWGSRSSRAQAHVQAVMRRRKSASRQAQRSRQGSVHMQGWDDGAMEFRILGPLEVVGPHGAIEIVSARQRAILALLVLHVGETVTTHRLIEEVWADDPPP